MKKHYLCQQELLCLTGVNLSFIFIGILLFTIKRSNREQKGNKPSYQDHLGIYFYDNKKSFVHSMLQLFMMFKTLVVLYMYLVEIAFCTMLNIYTFLNPFTTTNLFLGQHSACRPHNPTFDEDADDEEESLPPFFLFVSFHFSSDFGSDFVCFPF